MSHIKKSKLQNNYQTLFLDKITLKRKKIKKIVSFIQMYFRPTKIVKYLKKNKKRSISQHLIKIKLIFKSETHTAYLFNNYQHWIKKNFPSENYIKKQKKKVSKFKKQPLISIIVPVYNTPKKFLIECINSVINQSYPHWELCLVDDSSSSIDTINTIQEYADKFDNIKATFRKKNGHICAASNSALRLTTGDFVALLDHDDILWPNALFEVVKTINNNNDVKFIYSDEDKIMEDGITHTDPFFKPDWSPDYLRSINYITHFAVLKKTLINKIGGFIEGFEGAQDWDLFLRATNYIENNSKEYNHPYLKNNKICHIQKILYSWRISRNSTASSEYAAVAKDYAYKNQKKILEADLKARKLKGIIKATEYLGLWNIQYSLKQNVKISIIIPTRNRYDFINRCINSIYKLTSYKNYEILIIDTGSNDKKVFDLYQYFLTNKDNFKVYDWKKDFNFSAVCNFGASKAKGDYFLFLNNDTEALSTNWLERMLGLAQLNHIGAVGAKLLYPNKKIQHLGGLLGITSDPNKIGIAGHAYRGQDEFFRNFDRLAIKNYSFVTGACLMIKKEKFLEVNGFDENFQIAFNDVDFCLRLNIKGYFHAVEPYVVLLHKESATLKKPGENGRDLAQWKKEINLFIDRWENIRENDPFYNVNLSLNTENFSLLR